MAETLVKEKVCVACGADLRPQALFCYNCGSAVKITAPPVESNNNKTSDAWFKDELVEQDKQNLEFQNTEREDELIADDDEEIEEAPEQKFDDEVVEDEEAEKRDLSKMDSAAKLNRRGKSIQKKRVEIVWEEHDNAPNGWFIFFAVILTLLAVAIWIISTYLE